LQFFGLDTIFAYERQIHFWMEHAEADGSDHNDEHWQHILASIDSHHFLN